MNILGNSIKTIRKSKKMTQKQLAELTGFKQNTISNHENGNRQLDEADIRKYAEALQVSPQELFDLYNISNPQVEIIPSTLQKITATSSELEHKRQLAVLNFAENELSEQLEEQNTVENSKNIVADNIIQFPKLFSYDYYDQPASAGTGQYLNDVRVEQVELPIEVNADFVIPIYGDSMEPEYHSGDYVFVKLTYDLSDGDIGVFEYYGDAYIKQLVINDSGAFLHSLNSKYDDLPVNSDSDFRIIGKVIGRYSEED